MLLRLTVLLALVLPIERDGPDVVRVGHWLEVRGELGEDGVFRASRVDLLEPQEYEVLIGTVPEDQTDHEAFVLLGQPIDTSAKTEWQRMARGSQAGKRVKIEGRYRGPRKFSAREISPRGEGRDRLGGRVDELRTTGEGVVARIMRLDVLLPPGVEVRHEEPLAEIPLAPERIQAPGTSTTDEDDLFGTGFYLTDTLRFTGQIELRSTREEDFNLDENDEEDRTDHELSFRGRFVWEPTDRFAAVGTFRTVLRLRDDDQDGRDSRERTRLGETFGYWSDLLGSGWDLQVGRQDFDDRREWIYDENLDAVRLIADRPGYRFEVSLSTTLADGSDRDEDSLNAIAYISNNDRDRNLAAYVVHRDIDAVVKEEPTHLGVRAYGEWLPDNKSWLDAAYLDGERGNVDVGAWGFDVGSTWSPDSAQPLSFTAGYAFGTGDRDPTAGTDNTFRQTGFQDNNDKFAGVTSFRYYGELFEPELGNMQILTAGIGTRLAEKTSLDLVFHHYKQDHPRPELVDSGLKSKPNGIHTNLGYEIDLILGSRRWEDWDVELVGGWFDPGSAFDKDDDAFLAKIQVRYRF